MKLPKERDIATTPPLVMNGWWQIQHNHNLHEKNIFAEKIREFANYLDPLLLLLQAINLSTVVIYAYCVSCSSFISVSIS